jgi:hypothetical protein
MPQDAQPDIEVTSHSTPLRAVRQHCLECCNGNHRAVRNCPAVNCPLWPHRHGHRPNAEEKAAASELPVYPLERNLGGASALRAVRRRCIDCSGGTDAEVRSCQYGPNHSAPCSLHPFRGGSNPYLAPRSAEWRQAAADRLASFKRPPVPKSLSQNPMSAGAQVLDGEQPPGQALG